MPTRRGRAAATAVLAGALLVLAGVAAAGGPLLSAHPAPWRPHLVSPTRTALPRDTAPHGSVAAGFPKTPPPPTRGLPHWVAVVAAVIGIAGLSLLLAAVASVLLRAPVWRALLPALAPAQPPPTTTDAADEQRDLLATRVDAALADLDEAHDPRAAVIASWRRLELAVAELGVERRPSETSGELAARILASLAVDGRAVAQLNRLYRDARYSPHTVLEVDRDAARDALRAVRRDLDRVTSAPVRP